MNSRRLVLRLLLLEGRGQTLGAAAFAVVAVIIAVIPDRELRLSFEFCMAIAIAWLFRRASERLQALAFDSARLGLPEPLRVLQTSQRSVLAILLVVPWVIGLRYGLEPRTLLIPLVTVGACAALTLYPFVGAAFLVLPFIDKFMREKIVEFAFGPTGAAVLAMASAGVIVMWLRLPARAAEAAGQRSEGLADARHETVHADLMDTAHARFEAALAPILTAGPGDSLSPGRLWLGMRFYTLTAWKPFGYCVLLSLGAMVSVHFLFDGRGDLLTYALLMAAVAMLVFGRFQGMHAGWMSTEHEQSLLVLTPRWPRGAALKRAVLDSLLSVPPQFPVFWLVISGLCLAFGWIEARMVLIAGLLLALTTLNCVGLLIFYMLRSSQRPRLWIAFAFLLVPVIGAGIAALGWAEESNSLMLSGVAIILIPSLCALGLLALRPLQIPVIPYRGEEQQKAAWPQ